MRLAGEPVAVTLHSWTGTIVAPDDYEGGIVRLDAPATYYNADGTMESLSEIRVFCDDVESVSSIRSVEPSSPVE